MTPYIILPMKWNYGHTFDGLGKDNDYVASLYQL